MAFVSEVTEQLTNGTSRIIRGTYTQGGGDTGGDVRTGLAIVRYFKIVPGGGVVTTNASVVDETFPLMNSGGVVTIVTDADEDGTWEAVGN